MLTMKNQLKNQKGIATVEAVTLLFIFILFMSFGVGFFNVVHTGILNSISARAYAFEAFRNRANLSYHRDTESPSSGSGPYNGRVGFRIHGIKGEDQPQEWRVTSRKISAVYEEPDEVRDDGKVTALEAREKRRINPVWIKTTYGICLNAKCGG